MHKVPVALHPEVEVTVSVAVARNEDEAARLIRGEDIMVARTEEQEAQAEALANAESFFEPEAVEAQRASEEAEQPAEESK
jgi:large subunit ribosomal protein L9